MSIYRDDYTDFIFNEVKSSDMKVWITNSRDLQMLGTPKFTDTFVSPTMGSGRYYTGTTVSNSDLTLKCIAINVTMQDWQSIQQWLNPNAKGKLQFNFNKWSYYDVKVSSQITGTSFVKGKYDTLLGDLYIIEFQIAFTTTSDYAALGQPVTGILNATFDTLDINQDTKEILYKYDVNSVSGNRYFMPMLYNAKEHYGKDSDTYDSNAKRIYIRQSTKLFNKVLYFDKVGFINKKITEPVEYILVENNIECDGSDSGTLVHCGSITIKPIRKSDGAIEDANIVIESANSALDFLKITTLNDIHGLSFYGLDIMITGTKEDLSKSFLFIEEEEGLHYVMNTGSYEMYPHLYVSAGTEGKKLKVFYNNMLKYDYTFNFEAIALEFNGRHGSALYNNMLAESSIVDNGQTKIPVVSSSVNNGVIAIESGRPEILKCKILDVRDVKIADYMSYYSFDTKELLDECVSTNKIKKGDNTTFIYKGKQVSGRCVDIDDINFIIILSNEGVLDGLKMIYFQPYGDIKYNRDAQVAYHLFTGAITEVGYDYMGYPIYEPGAPYGSAINNSVLTLNGYFHKDIFVKINEPMKKIIKVESDKQTSEVDAEYREGKTITIDEKEYKILQSKFVSCKPIEEKGEQNTNTKYLVTYDLIVEGEVQKRCCTLIVPSSDVDASTLDNIKKIGKAYLSICDTNTLNVIPTNTESYISLQTRDAY